jgi:hypothetical protein
MDLMKNNQFVAVKQRGLAEEKWETRVKQHCLWPG